METLDAESLAHEFRSRVDALPSPKVPRVRPIRREFSRRISSAHSEQVLELAALLIDLDLRIWAYEIVHYDRPNLRELDAATIESLGHGLAVCEILADDRDDMVVKALSWALRVLTPHDPTAVQHFLTTNHHRLAARVKRETHNKLTTGLKNPRKTSG